MVRKPKAKPSKAKPSKAKPSKAKPSKAKSSKAKPPKTKPKTKPPKAKPNRSPSRQRSRDELTPHQRAARPLIEQALAEADAGNLERAAERMLAAADADPTDWRLPNEAGVYYYSLERYDDALRCYDRTLAIAPGNVALMMNRALALILTDRDDEALAALQAILAIDPLHASAFFEIGKLHQKRGRHRDALEYFDTALVHATLPTMFNVIGGPHRDMHLLSLVMLNKARALFALGREDDAVAQAGALVEELGDAGSTIKLANELVERDRPAMAARILDVLLASQPDHGEARELRERLA